MEKKYLYINTIFFLLIPFGLMSQVINYEASLDVLKASTTPAFQLLEVDEEKIQRPSTVTDFKVSLISASKNLTVIPENYSVQLAPYWIWGGDQISYNDFKSNKLKQNFLQSLNFSIGTITTKDTSASNEFRKVSVGVAFSIFRGNEINAEFEKVRKAALKEINVLYNAGILKAINEDAEYNKIEEKYINSMNSADTLVFLEKMKARGKEVITDFGKTFIKSKEYKDKSEILENTKFERYGFKMDLAAGLVLDFPSNDINLSNISKFGTWITFGWDQSKKWSAFFVSRLLAYPNILDSSGSRKNSIAMDIGSKVIIDNIKKLSVSGEIIYRAFIKKINNEENKVRYILNFSYEIFPNQSVTFNIGKEFDKKAETGGNLIAALNLVLGFGSLRPF